jgi:hypothetical protein
VNQASNSKKSEEETQNGKNKPAALARPIRWAREAVAVLAWALLLTQLLLVDLTGWLAARWPLLEMVFRYRFLFLLGTIAFLWLVLGNRRFTKLCGYILAYPFVVACWHLPRILFKNWAVVVAFSPAVHSIVVSLRLNFIVFVAALVSAFLVVLASETIIVAASMAVLGGTCYTTSLDVSGWRSHRLRSSLILLA